MRSTYHTVDVSLIIVNFNTFELTGNCIRSVEAITKGVTYEIIMVDNASTDHPAEDFAKLFPNLIILKSSENIGFAKGNNLGIAQAKGKYILLLNSDTILLNDAISATKKFLDDNAQVAVAAARLEYPDGKVQHNCHRFPSIRWSLFELLRLQKIFPSIKKFLFGSFFDHNSVAYPDWVWGTFFMFRKDLLLSLPSQKLADGFFMYVEDMQWCKDFALQGKRVAFVPEARIVHLMGKSGGAKSILMKNNLEIFLVKNYSWIHRKFLSIFQYLLRTTTT